MAAQVFPAIGSLPAVFIRPAAISIAVVCADASRCAVEGSGAAAAAVDRHAAELLLLEPLAAGGAIALLLLEPLPAGCATVLGGRMKPPLIVFCTPLKVLAPPTDP